MALTTIAGLSAVEADLAAGRLACPECERPLAPWGWARPRTVRMRSGVRPVRPRRARCGACASTHVLLPAWCVPRRRDGAEVIGAALLANAHGDGHRVIAERLGRPPATVRGWLRAARRRAEAIRACAVRWAYALDQQLGATRPARSPLGDAVEAVATAARAWLLRFGPRAGPWEVAVALTGGLLSGPLRDPLGL